MIHKTFTGDYIDLSQVVAISRIYLKEYAKSNQAVQVNFDVQFKNTPKTFTCNKVYKEVTLLETFEGIKTFTKALTKDQLKPTIDAWKQYVENII